MDTANKNTDYRIELQLNLGHGAASSSVLCGGDKEESIATMIYNACTLLIYYAGSALLFLAFSTLRLVQLLPFAQWIVFGLMNKIATIQMPREDYWHSLFTWPMFTSMRSSILLELQKLATRGNLAPDSHLISVDGKSRCSLLELCRGNRPLVVNFCSWTCPIFRARVGEFLSIVREFGDVADFLTVYVEEAHPSDGWAFKVSTLWCIIVM